MRLVTLIGLLLASLLACAPPQQSAPTPAGTKPAESDPFDPSHHDKVILTVVGPKGTNREIPLRELAGVNASQLESQDSLFAEPRRYEGLNLEALLSLSPDPGEIVMLKFHCRDGFVSEVSLESLKKGQFLLAYRDLAIAPRTFLPASENSYLQEEPDRLDQQAQAATGEEKEKLERKRDHLATLRKDLNALGDQGPFFPIFISETEKWNPPFCVNQITFASAPTDRTAALPQGLPEDHPAQRGAVAFEKRCAVCHSVNGVGGEVGPELNQPQSVTSYWTEEALRQLLHDPKQVRHNSKMPALRLKEPVINDILAYLRWMDQHR